MYTVLGTEGGELSSFSWEVGANFYIRVGRSFSGEGVLFVSPGAFLAWLNLPTVAFKVPGMIVTFRAVNIPSLHTKLGLREPDQNEREGERVSLPRTTLRCTRRVILSQRLSLLLFIRAVVKELAETLAYK